MHGHWAQKEKKKVKKEENWKSALAAPSSCVHVSLVCLRTESRESTRSRLPVINWWNFGVMKPDFSLIYENSKIFCIFKRVFSMRSNSTFTWAFCKGWNQNQNGSFGLPILLLFHCQLLIIVSVCSPTPLLCKFHNREPFKPSASRLFIVRASPFFPLICVLVLNTQHQPTWMRPFSVCACVCECECVVIPHDEYNDAIEFFALFTWKSNSTPIMVICWMEWLIFIIKMWRDETRKKKIKTWNCSCEGCLSAWARACTVHWNWIHIQTPSCRGYGRCYCWCSSLFSF